jgi:aryl-alcohol dehydrogenase-like predicted oxidoreductase
MEYRQLGRSGLRFSELILGTMTFGGRGDFRAVGDTGLEGARRQIDMALEAGVNVIDTADVYSTGASEEIIGKALSGGLRDRVLLATKARFPMGPGPNDAGLSRQHLIEACEASLRRLQTDHIDLYQVHEWDGLTPLEETLGALEHLLQAGKVRYVGCSNFAGCYRRGQPPPPGSRHASEWNEPPVYDEDKLYDTIEVLVQIAEDNGVSAAQVALAWLLDRPGITSVIVGARTDEQLADNLAAATLELSPEEHARLEAVSRPPLIYPFWHQAASAADRLSDADLSLIGPHLQD